MTAIKDLWRILNGQCTFVQGATLLGCTWAEELLNKAKEMDFYDSSTYFAICNALKEIAYQKLVELKEIDGSKIYSLGKQDVPRKGDMGIKSNQHFRYDGTQWIFAY